MYVKEEKNINYAIFRVEPIQKLNDLSQIGRHNQRKKESYNSNKDIDITKSHENVTLIECNSSYIKRFDEITTEFKKQHEEKQKTIRTDRKKIFHQAVDSSNSVVADEMIFTATHEFFNNMDKEEIMNWADTCMKFVCQDLGYKKDQILHSVIHMDEKTPHIHVVVVPLIKKLDKRSNELKYTISKKEYIKNKDHLSLLQDKYHERLVNNNFKLERGIKNSDNEHITIKDYKKITRKISNEISKENYKLNEILYQFEEQSKLNKELVLDKDYIKVKKETFSIMENVIDQSKRIVNKVPKIDNLMKQVDGYVKSYKNLENENSNIRKEVNHLKYKNYELQQENLNLKSIIRDFLELLKVWFRKMLHIGTKRDKDHVVNQLTNIYNQDLYAQQDLIDISKDTSMENEINNMFDIDRDFEI